MVTSILQSSVAVISRPNLCRDATPELRVWQYYMGKSPEHLTPSKTLKPSARRGVMQPRWKSLQNSLFVAAAVCDRRAFSNQSTPAGAHRAPLQDICRNLRGGDWSANFGRDG